MWWLPVEKSLSSYKRDECSGSAAFVVPPSGCFLRKLLWPVCASSIRKHPVEVVYLCCSVSSETGLFFLQTSLFFALVLPSELCTTHCYTALSVNTTQQWTTELLQLTHQNTKSQLSHSPLIANLLWSDGERCFQQKFTFFMTVSPHSTQTLKWLWF